MKVLFISSVFPSPLRPNNGAFNSSLGVNVISRAFIWSLGRQNNPRPARAAKPAAEAA